MSNVSSGAGKRTILITGATEGIGRVAAEEIARGGGTLVLVGRNPEKTQRVVDEIKRASGNESVSHLLADLSLVGAVEDLAERFRQQHDRLDVLINNAGAMFTSRHVTSEGLEMTFALNHMAYFVLTRELMPMLEASGAGRVVNVASNAHFRARLDLNDLQYEKRRFSFFGAYAQSKFLNLLFTFELARRIAGKPVTANALHPGFVRSGFGKNDAWWMKAAVSVGGLFGRTPRQGAEGIIYLATSPEVQGVTGQYYMDQSTIRCHRLARDEEPARRLWETSERVAKDVLARAAS